MQVWREALVAIACVLTLAEAAPQAHAAGLTPLVSEAVLSADATYMARWVAASRDNRGKPYVIVDKKDARVLVFSPRGALLGESPALLGMARGDHSAPGIGSMLPSRIPTADRTTPAGRFESELGTNLNGEDVIWLDYDAGLAIHRLRPDAAQAARQRRLAAKAPEAHRVSAGCVVLPVSFYEGVLKPALAAGRGVVYVLPETRPVREVFATPASDL